MADSPLSDDSLSSIGASTEPLPASDGPVISPPSGSHRQPRSPPLPSRKQLAGGNESDSTLTEQSSSEGRGGGRDGEDDEEEEHDDDGAGEPTPKASRPPKHSHDELRRPLDDGLSELSSAGEDSEEEEVDIKPKANALKLAVNNSPPRVPLMGELNARRATSRPASYTEVDNDEDDVLLAAKEDDEDLSEPEAEEKRAASSSKRGGKAARGARARGARAPARGRVTKKAAASRREESPILSDEEAEVKSPAASGPVLEVVVSPPRGKGRVGKGGRAPRGGKGAKGGAKNAAAAAKSRSRSPDREASVRSETSDKSINSRKRPREADDSAAAPISLFDSLADLPPLPTDNLPPLPADDVISNGPAGLGELTTDLAAVKAEGEAAVATEAMDVDGEEPEVESEESSQVKKKAPAKRSKKGGKGKEKVKDQDPEVDETGTPVGSDHEDADSDDAFMRKRAEAMEALTRIEIEFARLRDRLYMERMAEVEKERIGVENGTHPELLHLTQLIEMRRTKKLELAKKWLEGLEAAYERHREGGEHAVWTWWANGRSELQTNMLEEANTKRRKLEREKRKMDRPKDDGLTPLLAPRPLPAIPLHHRRRLGFDGEGLTEAEITWSLRHPDICVDASVSALDDDSTLTDLERMGLREPDRHAGPYTFEQLYGGSQYGIPPYADPRGVPTALPAPFGYPSFDVAPPVPQQHPFGAANPFGTFPSANTTHPLSNPRSGNFPKEMGGTASGRPFEDSPFASGVYGGEAHAPAWQKSVGGGEDRRRQRTPSAGGGGLADSLDIVAGSKERHGEAGGEGVKDVNGTGHNTLKARPSLDFHMAHSRSPKAPPKVNGTGVGSSSTTTERAGFLSIPPYRGPSSSSTTATAHAPAVNGASDLPPVPAASTASAAPPPQPQTTPLLGTMPLKAAPTLFGGSPAEGAGAFAHFGSGIEAGTR